MAPCTGQQPGAGRGDGGGQGHAHRKGITIINGSGQGINGGGAKTQGDSKYAAQAASKEAMTGWWNVTFQGCQNGYMGNDTLKCSLIYCGTLFLVFLLGTHTQNIALPDNPCSHSKRLSGEKHSASFSLLD